MFTTTYAKSSSGSLVATSEAVLLHVTDHVGNEYFRDEPLRGPAAVRPKFQLSVL